MELPTSSLYLAVPIVVAGLATLWAIWPEKYVGWLQAMKQKLKMTPAMRDLLDTDQKTANSAEKFEGIAGNQSIQQLMRETPAGSAWSKNILKAKRKQWGQIGEEMERMPQLMRDARRKRLEQEHPEFNEKTVDQIVEEMERMPQLITDAYRERLKQRSPRLDEATMDNKIMLFMPMHPARLVESALAERMHLPEEARMQEVAMLIVVRHLLP